MPSQASLSLTALTFPATRAGKVSPQQTVTLTNSGTRPLQITRVALGGASPSGFKLKSFCARALAPGASCRLALTFAPKTPGTILAPGTVLAVSGDSICSGYFQQPPWPQVLGASNSLFAGRVVVQNKCVAGYSIADMQATYVKDIQPFCRAATKATPTLLVADGISNSISGVANQPPISAAASFAQIQQYIATATADGCTVYATTMRARSFQTGFTQAQEVERLAYNLLIRTGTTPILDFGSILTNPDDRTYYGDGIHLNAVGQVADANFAGPVLTSNQAVIVLTTNAATPVQTITLSGPAL